MIIPQNNTHIKGPEGELYFRASVIDGTALAITDILKEKFPEPTQDIKLCVFCVQEFYKLLSISVQTENEEQFKREFIRIIEGNKLN